MTSEGPFPALFHTERACCFNDLLRRRGKRASVKNPLLRGPRLLPARAYRPLANKSENNSATRMPTNSIAMIKRSTALLCAS
jgi:hypothetical protein